LPQTRKNLNKISKLKQIATQESFQFIPIVYHILSLESNEEKILYGTEEKITN